MEERKRGHPSEEAEKLCGGKKGVVRVTQGTAWAQPGQQKGLAGSTHWGQTAEDLRVPAHGCVHLVGTPDSFIGGGEMCFRRISYSRENKRGWGKRLANYARSQSG